MKLFISFLQILAITGFLTGTAMAGGPPEPPGPPPDAEAMIRDCAAQTISKPSGRESNIERSKSVYILCLEDVIIRQFSLFYPKLDFHFDLADKRSTVDKARSQLKAMRTPIRTLYWWMFNAYPGCDAGCGTRQNHLDANAETLEMMIKDIIAQRLKYQF